MYTKPPGTYTTLGSHPQHPPLNLKTPRSLTPKTPTRTPINTNNPH